MGKPMRGVVAAGHPLTAEAGVAMLEQGGNAFDAAVAAVLTACVTESTLTSAAGGGFLLAHTAQGEDTLFDFFCQTPAVKDLDRPPHFYPIQANFGDAVQEFHIGLGSMAVPGVLAGLLQVHQRLGVLPLDAIAQPALHWAKHGVEIDPFRAYCFELLEPILTATPAASAIYAPQGHLLQQGERLHLPEFADFLNQVVKTGAASLHDGEIARQIAHDCAQAGGYLTLEDLQRYRVIERKPLSIAYRGTTLLTNPPPSSGGTLIAFALRLLEQANLGALEPGSPHYLSLLRAAMSLTNQARRDGYDANLYQPNIADYFLSEPHLAHYRQQFEDLSMAKGRMNKWGSTTHVSVVDAAGNAASVTTSNGEGASYVIPGTGVMINNMLGEEDLNPLGFHQWQPNQRISSMMAPTLVLQDNRPQLVLGSGGSNRIRTAILQVILNKIDFAMPLQAAVRAPRIHWERGSLHLEPGFDQAALAAAGVGASDKQVWWQQANMFFGGVHAVAIEPDGRLEGAGDERRGGAVAFSD
ncbi:MAG TPA: gamma-glutamyltransferase [Trichocoleus sp.]